MFMDAELRIGDQVKSANVSILPLVSTEEDRLGTLLMIEDTSTEKRMKSTMSRHMDPTIADQLLAEGEDVLGGRSIEATVFFLSLIHISEPTRPY